MYGTSVSPYCYFSYTSTLLTPTECSDQYIMDNVFHKLRPNVFDLPSLHIKSSQNYIKLSVA